MRDPTLCDVVEDETTRVAAHMNQMAGRRTTSPFSETDPVSPLPRQWQPETRASKPPKNAPRTHALVGETTELRLPATLRDALGTADAPARRPAAAPQRSTSYMRSKRVFDFVIACLLLIVFSPVMLTIAALIKLDSPGPAVFRQKRLGAGLNEFDFFKFRTMVVDARERFPEHYAYEFAPGEAPQHHFKTAIDPRLTRVGRFIRRTSLDELPNLLNVVRGDMSMVGPRPEIPEMLPYYRPEQLCKFGVLPGVTGLAQISGRNLLRWAETNSLDVEYVQTRSARRDVSILLRTIFAVIGMVGAL